MVTRALLATAGIFLVAVAFLCPARPGPVSPLWHGSRYSRLDRDRAVRQGILFLDWTAGNPATFRDYGHDLIGAFYTIGVTSSDVDVSTLALRLGRRHARAWRRVYRSVPADSDPGELAALLMGADTAERFGLPDPSFRRQLRQLASRFTAIDFFGWDPASEPPPSDLPSPCGNCKLQNPRGVSACRRCGRALEMQNRYDLWTDALITTYMGDRFGVTMGGHWVDAVRWLPVMRPYPKFGEVSGDAFDDAVYAVTHLVYTYNDYNLNRIPAQCLPDEFEFLRTNLAHAIAEGDEETTGEYLDTLRAFGLTVADPGMRRGIEFVLSRQNPDGSFGDLKDPDPYNRYHTTWTAVDGLREYRWNKELPCLAP